jgi:hypothetical protein
VPLPNALAVQVASYQHVVVVMSIVLGLSLTQLLKGLAQLYRTRNRVRPYWLHTAWVVLLIFFSLLLWWLHWSYRSFEQWSFPLFLIYLSPMIVLYFLTSIVFPDPSDPVTSYKDYYYSNRVGFFGTFAVQVVLAHGAGMVVRGLPLVDPSNALRLATVVFLLIAMRSTSERVHVVVFVLSAIVIVAFTALFHLHLG